MCSPAATGASGDVRDVVNIGPRLEWVEESPGRPVSPSPGGIVDDLAMREFTPAQAWLTSTSCCPSGLACKSLILTSNRSPSDWYPLFPNPVVGESILDRVINTSHHLLLEGKSYWPRRRPGRTAPAARNTS